jgi:hypothetical protein
MLEGTIVCEKGESHVYLPNGFLRFGIDVKVDLSEIIDTDLEGFLDLISERAGFPLLQQQEYICIGAEDEALIFRVRGDISAHLEEAEQEPELTEQEYKDAMAQIRSLIEDGAEDVLSTYIPRTALRQLAEDRNEPR